ncbi:hypothetical protein DYB28_003671 [Aphanomyces astaci]|uniref:Uncharacterized protein n=1 Tax=Aphanomyces astaci TaxID=112090 RepID=A0A9X8DTJ8_APHAT|nr:hypothetical protein DYB28_003671 [Aphanomyces astaci]
MRSAQEVQIFIDSCKDTAVASCIRGSETRPVTIPECLDYLRFRDMDLDAEGSGPDIVVPPDKTSVRQDETATLVDTRRGEQRKRKKASKRIQVPRGGPAGRPVASENPVIRPDGEEIVRGGEVNDASVEEEQRTNGRPEQLVRGVDLAGLPDRTRNTESVELMVPREDPRMGREETRMDGVEGLPVGKVTRSEESKVASIQDGTEGDERRSTKVQTCEDSTVVSGVERSEDLVECPRSVEKLCEKTRR